jgi:hypothetical protein
MGGRTKAGGTVDFTNLDHADANAIPGATPDPPGPAGRPRPARPAGQGLRRHARLRRGRARPRRPVDIGSLRPADLRRLRRASLRLTDGLVVRVSPHHATSSFAGGRAVRPSAASSSLDGGITSAHAAVGTAFDQAAGRGHPCQGTFVAAARALSQGRHTVGHVMFDRAAEGFLAEPQVAVFAVAAPSGPPAAVPLWYCFAPGGPVWIVTPDISRKTQLVR